MQINEITASWDRATISLGAEFRQQVSKRRTPEIDEILRYAKKHMKCMENDEIAIS